MIFKIEGHAIGCYVQTDTPTETRVPDTQTRHDQCPTYGDGLGAFFCSF